MNARSCLARVALVALAVLPLALGADQADASSRHKGKASARTISRTFTNSGRIEINSFGSASPFPSAILVSGFKKGKVTDVDLVLKGFGHGRTQDVDVMLVAPDGRNALVMSDVGKASYSAGITIHLDDEAEVTFPDATTLELMSGTYRPENIADSPDPDVFDTTYAPIPSGNVALSTFDGGDPNGQWRLFVRDDTSAGAGFLADGWELTITAKVKGKKR